MNLGHWFRSGRSRLDERGRDGRQPTGTGPGTAATMAGGQKELVGALGIGPGGHGSTLEMHKVKEETMANSPRDFSRTEREWRRRGARLSGWELPAKHGDGV